jgi:hypothetical protein
MGMPRDRQQRVTLKRVDNDWLRFDIRNARRLIYEQHYAVDSKTLAKFLNAGSWVPTLVSIVISSPTVAGLIFIPECFFQTPASGIQLIQNAHCRLNA